jgi:hypothetical protein
MVDRLGNFPFWALEFDEAGTPSDGSASFLRELPSAHLTDLFVFSHGWNNDRTTAMALFTGFFGEVRKILENAEVGKRPNLAIGVVGVIWPSILFPGDAVPPALEGGAASLTANPGAANTLESELLKIFSRADQRPVLRDLLAMIDDQTPDGQTLLIFRDKLAQLASPNEAEATHDDLELRASTVKSDSDWMALLDAMSDAPSDSEGGAASFGSFFGRLWNGARNMLRVATYWEMKNRAGIVGAKGLGPLIGRVHSAQPDLKIHLLGHSFGARLVSYALTSLPDGLCGPKSPVKSLFLLQGAFSHFAFSDSLPFEPGRKGDLAGMAARVDGPLLTTYSLKDLAVGIAYPAASILSRQDAATATDLLYRWEGMGSDGAQAVNAANDVLGGVQTEYRFETGRWLNLDGNRVIVKGGPPSGAHGDIVHPETAWAALSAAKVVLP